MEFIVGQFVLSDFIMDEEHIIRKITAIEPSDKINSGFAISADGDNPITLVDSEWFTSIKHVDTLAFRDLDNKPNTDGVKSYHAAGIIISVNHEKATPNEKDILVRYMNPFDGYTETAWRTYTDIEIFNLPESEYDFLCKRYDEIDK